MRIFLLALLISLVAPACGGGKTVPATSPTPALSGAEIVSRAAETMQRVRSLHFVLEHQGGGTPIVAGMSMTQAEGDIVRPDRLKVKLKGTAFGAFISMEAVVIGSVAYMTNPLSGQWQKYDSVVSPLAFFDPSEGVAAVLRGIRDVALVGEGSHVGAQVYQVRGTINSGELKPFAGNVVSGEMVEAEAWIAKGTFHLLRAVLKGKITPNEEIGITRTLDLSRFDQPVTIEPPQ